MANRFLQFVRSPPDLGGAVAPDLQAFADRCYAWMVDWFGAPRDAQWRHRIVYGPFRGCGRVRGERTYYIMVNRTLRTNEQRFAECAEGLYERVTMATPGLGQTWWVGAMVGFLASQEALRREAMAAYAEHWLAHFAAGAAPPLDALKRTPAGIRRWIRFRAFPRGYRRTVARIGSQLQGAVGWGAICKLPGTTDWQRWLAGLPAAAAERAAAILEIER